MNGQWPPQRPPAWQVWAPAVPASQGVPSTQGAPPDAGEDYANKVAEVSVLRNRLQQIERDNARLHNELSLARDQGPSSEKGAQQKAEIERLQNELQYAKQDLMSSEGERKRLQSGLSALQTEFESLKKQHVEAPAPAPQPPPRVEVQPAPPPPPQQQQQQPQPRAWPTPVSTPPVASQQSVAAAAADEGQWRREVLLRELTRWEAASQGPGGLGGAAPAEGPAAWFSLREAVSRLSHSDGAGMLSADKAHGVPDDVAAAVAVRLKAGIEASKWAVVEGGARFAQIWVGLFPGSLSELVARAAAAGAAKPQPGAPDAAPGARLFEALADALHCVVLDIEAGGDERAGAGSAAAERQGCAAQLLEALVEVAGKLRPPEFTLLRCVLRRPSLCALLAVCPSQGSLHRPCMRLLQVLLQSPELFALAHQADSHENTLLAVANLLIVPAISPAEADSCAGDDSPERQRCRVAALELFCRCLATAPQLDIVLQLRGAPSVDNEPVDTVLQRVVLLCHHELLCLGLHGHEGGPWHDAGLRRCAGLRQRAAELAMAVLSSFVWHAAPWAVDGEAASRRSAACAEACAALGRAGPLLASIVDMAVRRAPHSPAAARLLAGASVLRALLVHADGESCKGAAGGCCAPPAIGKAGDAVAMAVG